MGTATNRSGVAVHDLHVAYGELEAVAGVSLEVGPGEVVAMLGPNGAGKTSTLRCIEGYQRPSAGEVRIDGLDPVADHAEVVAGLGIMLQEGGVYPALSPARVLALFSAYYERPRPVEELLSLLELEAVARTPWRKLSGGERQRLSLALCLVGRPSTVVLDEPTAGVDPEGRAAIRGVVAELRREGAAVLLTTHELAEAERVADRVVVIDRGRVVASEAVAGNPAARLTLSSTPGLELSTLAAEGYVLAEVAPGRYQLEGEASPRAIAAVTAWFAGQGHGIAELSTGSSLEERYLAILEASRGPGA